MAGRARSGRWRIGAAAGLAALWLACSQGEQQAAQTPPASDAAPPAAATTTPPAAATPPGSEPVARAAPAAEAAKPAAEGDIAKGKQVYAINCTACHNADPSEDGVLGPAVAGSSLELVTARVVRGNYPPGYTPKRPTQQMVALPHLASSVPALTAYLSSVKAK